MRTHECGHYISCVCAIAVRYGDDVIVIDMCSGGATVRFPSNKLLHEEMKVTRDQSGKIFKVSYSIYSLRAINFPVAYHFGENRTIY